MRYWLTFDRPTRLVARLTKGTGIVEATEEETLIALGEVSAPTAAACVAKAAQGWKFPAPPNGQTTAVSYPFVFN